MQQVSKQLIKGLPRRIALMLLDCGLIVFCYYLAILLRFDGEDSIVPAAVLRAEVIRAMAPMLRGDTARHGPDALIRPAHLYDRVLVRRTV